MLLQHSFVFIPANISESWCSDARVQVLQMRSQLNRLQHDLDLIAFGDVTLLPVLVSAMTSIITLSKSIQNAHFLNDLAQNTSKAPHNQVNIDD